MVVQAGLSHVLCFRILPGEVSSLAQLRKHLFELTQAVGRICFPVVVSLWFHHVMVSTLYSVSLWFYDQKRCFLLTSSWRPPLGVRSLLQFLAICMFSIRLLTSLSQQRDPVLREGPVHLLRAFG